VVALDFYCLKDAYGLAAKVAPYAGIFKIGKQLFTAEGPEAVRKIASLGLGIFLDLKYHDIPNTVASAVTAACELPGLRLLNMHASGGLEMMRAAVAACQGKADAPALLGVTVLTSLNAKALRDLGVASSPSMQVLRLAKLAKRAGLSGVVCSAHEVKAIRKACGKEFLTVVGGTRPGGNLLGSKDDQSRIMSPGDAVRTGANYLVVGRPIYEAADPVAAARAIAEEIAAAEGGATARAAGR
jgi:orotidine-5'-phosphate decarboxylase